MSAYRRITCGIFGLFAGALLTAGFAQAQTADAAAPDAAAGEASA